MSPVENKLDRVLRSQATGVAEDASSMVTEFEKAFEAVSKQTPKPNVLMIGITGSGKSTLINAIFGSKVAQAGFGIPMTKHWTKYSCDLVDIYDTRGIDLSNIDAFLEETTKFLDTHREVEYGESGAGNAIHVVWYIVDASRTRFQPFEARICRELFNDVPLIFLLNKADLSSQKDLGILHDVITRLELRNCRGIFHVIGSEISKLKTIEVCPRCHCDDIVIRKKEARMTCMNCNYVESLRMDNGLSATIEATTQVLPDFLRDAFVSAQNVCFQLKEESARQIIMDFWHKFGKVHTQGKLEKIITEMMARLCILWEFKYNGIEYSSSLARDFLRADFSWHDRLNLLLQTKTDMKKIRSTALGILWNRSLRNFSNLLFDEWSLIVKEPSDRSNLARKYDDLFATAFEIFNEENLLLISKQVASSDISMVLG